MSKIGDFQFDQRVVEVFPDMIARSVPGYGSILSMIAEIAERYVISSSNIYDLGCSLGACTQIVRTRVPEDCTIYAIDSSSAMIEGLRKRLDSDPRSCQVVTEVKDILDTQIINSSLSVLNFTLQFVPRDKRQPLLNTIAQGTRSGGVLVLSEKICFEEPKQQELLTELHHAFKKANGYSDLEISQKRTALEKTLIPETLEMHLSRLTEAGFQSATCWFQCFNFVSILAIK